MKSLTAVTPRDENAHVGIATSGQETQYAIGDSEWEICSNAGFLFQDEVFYTITPIGFCYYRREALLASMERVLQGLPAADSVLDFGCGDGFLTCRFARQFQLHGVEQSRRIRESQFNYRTGSDL